MQYHRADLYSFHPSKGIEEKHGILFADFVRFLLRIGMRKILAKAARYMRISLQLGKRICFEAECEDTMQRYLST